MASDNGGAHPKYFPRTEIDIGDEDRDRDGAIANDKGAPLRRLESFEINGSEPSIGNSFVSQVSSMYLHIYVFIHVCTIFVYARMVKVSMLEIRTCLGPSACMYAQVCVCIHVRTLLCNLLFCSIWDKFKK